MVSKQWLIDANALSVEVDKSKHDNQHPQGMIRVNHRNEHDHFLRMIYAAPTVDAVEVVRCKECKYRRIDEDYASGHYCVKRPSNGGYFCEDNDFCSYGERKNCGNG